MHRVYPFSRLAGLLAFEGSVVRANFEAIQYLRAVAAIMVVYYHGRAFLPAENGLAAFGMQGVDIFFVISGFIMAYTAMAGDTSTPGWSTTRDFWWKRIIRIVPLYCVATFYQWKLEIFTGTLDWTFVQDLLFIPHFSTTRPEQIWPKLVPGWTINYEMFFYLVFGLALLSRRWAITITLTAFTLLVGIGHLTTDSPDRSAWRLFYTNSIILEFGFGVLVFVCFQSMRRFSPALLMKACIVLATSSAVVLAGLPRMLSAGVPAMFLVMTLVLWRNVPKNAGLRLLGDASYSIYLFHGTGLGWSHKVLKMVWPNAVAHPMLCITFYVTFAVGVGIVMHFVAERPLLALMRKGGLAHVVARVRRGIWSPRAMQVPTSATVSASTRAPLVTSKIVQAYALHDFPEIAPINREPGLVSSSRPPRARAAATVQVKRNVIFDVPRSSLSAW